MKMKLNFRLRSKEHQKQQKQMESVDVMMKLSDEYYDEKQNEVAKTKKETNESQKIKRALTKEIRRIKQQYKQRK